MSETSPQAGVTREVGELAWDDPVEAHLPSFRLHDPWVTREVTIRDLLTHRAGLGNADLLWYGADRSREEILAKLPLVEPAYSFRGGYAHPLYDTVEVREEDGGLRLLAGPRRTARLEHWHYDSFRAHWDREWQGSALVTFALDASGEPARLWAMGLGFEREQERSEEDAAGR